MPAANCCMGSLPDKLALYAELLTIIPPGTCVKGLLAFEWDEAAGEYKADDQAGVTGTCTITCDNAITPHVSASCHITGTNPNTGGSCDVSGSMDGATACNDIYLARYVAGVGKPCCAYDGGAFLLQVSKVPTPAAGAPQNVTPSDGCGCPSNTCSSEPIRYATGEVILSASDLSNGGYGVPWGQVRTFAPRLSTNDNLGNGYNWQVQQWPYLFLSFFGNAVVCGYTPNQSYKFLRTSGGLSAAWPNIKQTLELDTANSAYRFKDRDGSISVFDSLTGRFVQRITPAGDMLTVTDVADNGFNPQAVERSTTVDGVTTTDRYSYSYSMLYADPVLLSLTLSRKVGGGSFESVERVNYTYYERNDPHGLAHDLKLVTKEVWGGSGWQTTGNTLYRYYLYATGSSSSSSSSSSGGSSVDPRGHLLKYVLNPSSYDRMVADGYDPLTATDAELSLYADNYFEYDEQRRVTKELVDGGSRTFLFSYAESGFDSGVNSWKTKTTEALPDGTQNIVYSNYAGQTLLFVVKSGSDEWITFYQYGSDFRMTLQASPSAVTGYDEAYADLLNYNSGTGKYQYLRDSAGLIQTWTYHAPSGYVALESVQEGQTGTSIKRVENAYSCCDSGGGGSSSSSSSSSSGGCTNGVWLLAQQTVYPSDTNQSLTQVTSYAYTFHPGTCAVQQKTTTLPVVPPEQNGSGVAATRKEYYDQYGNLTWSMNERGFITRMAYDIPTGAMTQQVADADTSLYSDAPAGWTTPSGGGLNLVTDITVDSQGRMTQSLGPSHSIDLAGTATTIRRATWLVYDDANHVTYAGQGYATGTSPSYSYTLVNPVSITKMDAGSKVLEQIQATASSTSGTLASIISTAGGGAAAFPQTSYSRWTTNQYTDCCLAASTRVYHTIPASGEGTSGTNYDETDFGYDVMKRRNRTVTPGGTITYQVYDARGLVSSTWIGTNDNGATDQDPSGGGASGNNMVLVTGNVYDGGADGGDGNLTQQTQYASASDTRVTSFTYDFRDRRITTDGEVDAFAKVYYDNLDRVVKTERYNTTAGGNLIARSETKFDPRGQVYQTIRYAVDPSTGTVGNSLTDNTWYDAAGNAIKSLPAGSDLFTKTVYDSLGRTTTQYVGYDTAETGYPG